MTDEIHFIGDLQRLEIKPGDKFILKVSVPLKPEQVQRILRNWEDFAGKGVRLLILEAGMELGAINTG